MHLQSLNHLQVNTLFGLELVPRAQKMFPNNTLYIMGLMQLQFEAALGYAFTKKYLDH